MGSTENIVYRGQLLWKYICGLFENQPHMPHILGPFWFQIFSIAATVRDTQSEVLCRVSGAFSLAEEIKWAHA